MFELEFSLSTCWYIGQVCLHGQFEELLSGPPSRNPKFRLISNVRTEQFPLQALPAAPCGVVGGWGVVGGGGGVAVTGLLRRGTPLGIFWVDFCSAHGISKRGRERQTDINSFC